MKAAEARALIGKRVHWAVTSRMWIHTHSAVFVEVRGKNVMTSDGEWLWLPSITKPTKVEDAS